MKRILIFILLFIGMVAGCKKAFFQTDSFPKKLQNGCATLEECDVLVAEAKHRVANCRPNTIGYIPCRDANADLEQARRLRDIQVNAEQDRKMAIIMQESEARRKQEEKEEAARKAEYETMRKQQEADLLAKEEERLQILEIKTAFEEGVRFCTKGTLPRYGELPDACHSRPRDIPEGYGDCGDGQIAWLCTTQPYENCTQPNENSIPPIWCCPETGCAFSKEDTQICREKLHRSSLGIWCSGQFPPGCEYTVQHGEKNIHCCNIIGRE